MVVCVKPGIVLDRRDYGRAFHQRAVAVITGTSKGAPTIVRVPHEHRRRYDTRIDPWAVYGTHYTRDGRNATALRRAGNAAEVMMYTRGKTCRSQPV